MKPRTEAIFQSQITEDRNWRIREISDLKAAIRRGDNNEQRVLLRALVAICYAHWEGYVRFAAKQYMEHIALRRRPYRELNAQFRRNYFLPRLAALASSKTSVADRCELVNEILNSADRYFTHVNEDLINTKSNLNFEVFRDLCLVCGISTEAFLDKADFIDKILLKRRNAIAHGEDTMIDIKELDEVSEQTIELIRRFGDALENHVVLKTYHAT